MAARATKWWITRRCTGPRPRNAYSRWMVAGAAAASERQIRYPPKKRSMSSTPLSYSSPNTPRSLRRWPWRTLSAVAFALLLLLAAATVPVRQVESRMDSVTGSMTWKTVWLFGITSGPRRCLTA